LHSDLERAHRPVAWLHPSTLALLNTWQKQPIFQELSSEWQVLYDYKQSWLSAPYPPTMVTADVVLRCRDSILLIERSRRPGKGLLALPGGFIEPNETVYQSALRELAEETSIEYSTELLQQFRKGSAVFDHPERSQRGRVITHAFYFDLGDQPFPKVTAGDDAGATMWTEIHRLESLEDRFHDDHFFILDRFLGIVD
jgi:bifunctional NMN adenylyltransferase/nudix hydrolase